MPLAMNMRNPGLGPGRGWRELVEGCAQPPREPLGVPTVCAFASLLSAVSRGYRPHLQMPKLRSGHLSEVKKVVRASLQPRACLPPLS